MLVSDRMIAELGTAAWIYGVSPEPTRYRFCVDTGYRTHLAPSSLVRVREVRGARDDTRDIGGRLVTSPLRTVVDLARLTAEVAPDTPSNKPPDDPDELTELALDLVLAALLRVGGCDPDDATRYILKRRGMPNLLLAQRRIERARALLKAST